VVVSHCDELEVVVDVFHCDELAVVVDVFHCDELAVVVDVFHCDELAVVVALAHCDELAVYVVVAELVELEVMGVMYLQSVRLHAHRFSMEISEITVFHMCSSSRLPKKPHVLLEPLVPLVPTRHAPPVAIVALTVPVFAPTSPLTIVHAPWWYRRTVQLAPAAVTTTKFHWLVML
jgi:hypothetical protein